MTYRHFDKHIISLLHFDFPYYAETNDGLNDDILGTVWKRSGNVKLVGSEIPADQIITGTPKFGYRCLHSESTNDYIYADTSSFSMNATTSYEVFCYVRPAASQSGNIFALFSGSTQILAVSLSNDLKVAITCPDWQLASSSVNALSLNTWHSLAVRFSPSLITIIIDGNSENFSLSSRTAINATSCRLGGINGQIDEFMFRDSFSTSLPTQPVQAVLNASELGGFGNGDLGNVVLSSNCIINSYANVTGWSSKSSFSVGNIYQGKFGGFSAGDEIMLLFMDSKDILGEYVFRKITSVSNGLISINEPLTAQQVAQPYTKTQVIKVPNFLSLTVNSGVTISPKTDDGNSGGVVVFRVKNDCTINGSVITSGLGRTRSDSLQLTHAKLIDTFLPGSGGGIMIFCGGTLTLPSSARLGATWDGSGKGGSPVGRSKGGNGGSGYGGAGGSDTDTNETGGNGGVGGGGGGADSAPTGSQGAGFDAGATGRTGGGFASGYPSQIIDSAQGGTQGITSGSAGISGGGGGAGGIGTGSSGLKASSGSNIVIITKTLKADYSAISSGGEGGQQENSGYQCGGGGTGFCYIACEVMN